MMNEYVVRLIRDYQEAVVTTMIQLREYIGDDKLLHGTPGRDYPRDGTHGDDYDVKESL